MLDVVHVFFEEDILPRWEQDTEVKDKMRETIYRDLYKTEYQYGHSSSQGRNAQWDFDGPPPAADPSMYDAPTDGSIKPYFPASTEEELFDILGTPMGE